MHIALKLSALKLSALGAALVLVGSAAVAGDAPAAYYPSLGYGQSIAAYDDGPSAYVDEPAYVGEPAHGDSYGPPPRAGRPGFGPPDCRCHRPRPPGPPVVYGRGEQRFAESEYDSGWRSAPPPRGHVEHREGGEQVYGAVRRQEFDYDSGWRFRRIAPPPGCACGGEQRERFANVDHMPDSFFADAGGVGPDEFEGGGGGGGGVIVGGGASAGSFAFASASARASASVRIHIGRHGGGHGGGHMSHGCGCKK
ncbi:MAG TPA: hypothetical protein VIJ94_01270 [Caulobacteraceae bacterium]